MKAIASLLSRLARNSALTPVSQMWSACSSTLVMASAMPFRRVAFLRRSVIHGIASTVYEGETTPALRGQGGSLDIHQDSGQLLITADPDAPRSQSTVRLTAVAAAASTEGSFRLTVVPPRPPQPPEQTNTIGMRLVLVRGGEFHMGGRESNREIAAAFADEQGHDFSSELPLHPVRITRDFYLGAHEVTQEDYRRVAGSNPSWFAATGGGHARVADRDTRHFPVERISWYDAVAFCRRLSDLPEEKRGGVELLFSAHGLPETFLKKGDPYVQHLELTIAGVLQRLGGQRTGRAPTARRCPQPARRPEHAP